MPVMANVYDIETIIYYTRSQAVARIANRTCVTVDYL